jgi:hypothetical protein
MLAFNPTNYGPVFAEFLVEKRLPVLGPGSPDRAVRSKLQGVSLEQAFVQPIRDLDMARCCLAGLWLYHDCLDESHALSQEIDTTTGSYWHGLMHRREPDYGNSKYWFRRVGTHPVFADLVGVACEAAKKESQSSSAFLAKQSAWDPFKFIDLCEAASTGRAPCEQLCREVQQREWELLFDYCYHQALRK